MKRIPIMHATIRIMLSLLALGCLVENSAAAPTNLVVAADGSGQFKTVQEAIMAVPAGSAENPVFIHIKPGTYKELIYIQHEKRFFHLIGEDREKTVLIYDLNATMTGPDGKPIGTFRTPSTTIDADDFTAENITFENSAGPVGQALAIRLDGDHAEFRNCRFLGWQDTILANRGRHYFENCYIAGHVDFIFGAATAFFEKCHIHCLKNGYITAASTPDDKPFGFVFSNCKITGETPEVKTYLGRPWRIYASTTFLNTEMSEVVRPERWHNWNKPEAEKTARYAEFNSTGPGASPTNRVGWVKQLTKTEAEAITAKTVLGGTDGWNPTDLTKATGAVDPKLQTDIEYGRAGIERLLLDARVPDGEGPFPIVIVVHGGGWGFGDKRPDAAVFSESLTKAGFTWFSINYRLAPTNRWPACFEDVQTAIRWVKANTSKYKGDPRHIALLGHSAGGHLVSLAGVLAEEDTRVQAVVGCAAPTDILADATRRDGLTNWSSMKNLLSPDLSESKTLKAMEDISPINHVKPGLPPFLLIHGDADKTVTFSQSLNFQTKLKENGAVCDLVVLTNGQHRITDWEKFDATYKEKMTGWLKEKLK